MPFCCGQMMDADSFYCYNQCTICGKTSPLTKGQLDFLKREREENQMRY